MVSAELDLTSRGGLRHQPARRPGSTTPLSPRSFLAAFLQYNTAANSLSTNIRFRWEYEPGSDLYVVYNSLRDTLAPGYPELNAQSFIVKFTRLFRF